MSRGEGEERETCGFCFIPLSRLPPSWRGVHAVVVAVVTNAVVAVVVAAVVVVI